MSVALGKGLEGELPKMKDSVTVIGTVATTEGEGELPKMKDSVTVIGTVATTEGGYTLTVEAVKRGDVVIIGTPKKK
ncbi:MAG: hypothetical protein ACYTGX_18175 [Planctomycetota bacterium]